MGADPPRPRLSPLPLDLADERARAVLDATAEFAPPTNPVLGTLMLHPDLAAVYMPFSDYLKNHGRLRLRDRELAILRTAWNCGADYQWVAHAKLAQLAGLTEEEIDRVSRGPHDAAWRAEDAAVIRAADELHLQRRIEDGTWDALKVRLDEASLVELVMLVGNYQMVAFLMNSAGILPVEPAPDLPGNTFAFAPSGVEDPNEQA